LHNGFSFLIWDFPYNILYLSNLSRKLKISKHHCSGSSTIAFLWRLVWLGYGCRESDMPSRALRMVWAAINPPDDIYDVNELDPVVVDRFHIHLQVPAEPSVSYYTKKAGNRISPFL
jgi:hypothetical protein